MSLLTDVIFDRCHFWQLSETSTFSVLFEEHYWKAVLQAHLCYKIKPTTYWNVCIYIMLTQNHDRYKIPVKQKSNRFDK